MTLVIRPGGNALVRSEGSAGKLKRNRYYCTGLYLAFPWTGSEIFAVFRQYCPLNSAGTDFAWWVVGL